MSLVCCPARRAFAAHLAQIAPYDEDFDPALKTTSKRPCTRPP